MSESEALENKSWLYAAVIMVFLALIVFLVQHFLIQLFDFTVEVTVFYIPAFAIIVFYVWRHFKSPH